MNKNKRKTIITSLILHIIAAILFGVCAVIHTNIITDILYTICSILHGVMIGSDIAILTLKRID